MRKPQFMSRFALRIQLTINRLAIRFSLSQDMNMANRGCNQMLTYNNYQRYSHCDGQQPQLPPVGALLAMADQYLLNAQPPLSEQKVGYGTTGYAPMSTFAPPTTHWPIRQPYRPALPLAQPPYVTEAFPRSQNGNCCSVCSRVFERKSSLEIHTRSHTGEQPFKCPHAGCDKSFSVRSNMVRHGRSKHKEQILSTG